MIEKKVRNHRALQTLQILKSHGPLPATVIHQLIEPPIRPRKLRGVLLRLMKNKLVERRIVKFTGQELRYYQIDQSAKSLSQTSKLINCDETELDQSFFRYRDFLHNDGVSLIGKQLRELFSNAEVIRDFSIYKKEEVKQILQHRDQSDDLCPDLLMRLKHHPTDRSIWIALEFEKTRKDDRRLIKKLRKYAGKTHIDGVVYICDSKYIRDSLELNYRKYVSGWARRISDYKSNFVMFGDSKNIGKESFVNLLRIDQKPAELHQWIRTLCVTPMNMRKDENF